jgi:mono/diheme cytochrome c family protein
MLKLLPFAPGLLLFAALGQPPGPTDQATNKQPTPEAAPTKAPSSESIARAKKMYVLDCAMCHGSAGDGKGDLVADMKLTLKDYSTAAALTGLSDQQLFDIIKDGKGQMPGEGPRLKPDDTWGMVYVVRSFAKK